MKPGRRTRKKKQAASSQGQLSAKSPSGPRDCARSISQPTSAAAPTSVAPTTSETASAMPIAGKAPRSAQAMNGHSRSGGGPSACCEGVDQVGEEPHATGAGQTGCARAPCTRAIPANLLMLQQLTFGNFS